MSIGEYLRREALDKGTKIVYLVIGYNPGDEGISIVSTYRLKRLHMFIEGLLKKGRFRYMKNWITGDSYSYRLLKNRGFSFIKNWMKKDSYPYRTYIGDGVERLAGDITRWSFIISEEGYLIIRFDVREKKFTLINTQEQKELGEFLKELLGTGSREVVKFERKYFESMLCDINEWEWAIFGKTSYCALWTEEQLGDKVGVCC